MGYTNRTKNTKTLLRYKSSLEVRYKFKRLLALLNLQDDNLYTVNLIKLDKLIQPILPKSIGKFYQVYEYEDLKIRLKVSLQRAISQLYYNKMKDDENDYLKLAYDSFKEFKAYLNNGHLHYGILTKIR